MKKVLLIISIFMSISSVVLAVDRDLPGIDLITRQEWGADESWLFSGYVGYDSNRAAIEKYTEDMDWLKENNITKYNAIRAKEQKEKDRINYLYKEFADELFLDKIKSKLDGVVLWWEMFYHYDKTKIVVHHTASSYSQYPTKDEFLVHLIGLYKFHALSRGWGDIGYNFIIDPWGNVYEGRKGGEGIVGAHVKYNNISSIGIALAGDFNIEKPTQAQIDSLVKLGTVLAVKYNINPYDLVDYHKKGGNEYPYIEDIKHLSVVGHTDAGYTSCPGTNLYSLLPDIRRAIYKDSKTLKLEQKKISKQKEINEKKVKLSLMDRIKIELNKRVNNYVSSHNLSDASILTEKITNHIKEKDISMIERKPVKVLLYELSTNFSKWEARFVGTMELINGEEVIEKFFSEETIADITYNKGKFYYNGVSYDKIIIHSPNVVIDNYDRKSYAGLPLNIFEGKLIFLKDKIKIGGNYVNTSAIINELSFFRYLRGIGEVGDNQPYQKIKAISLLVKGYIIFYIEKKNYHPSIPEDSYYNSIDDPRFFQKFVGKGFIDVGTKWQKAIKATAGRYVIYKGELAFTPYFSCSAGFTFDAKKKWGWTDTPYLKSKLDFAKCEDFLGHGVGLSGKGAELLANKGVTYGPIIRWYFPGTKIVNVRAK